PRRRGPGTGRRALGDGPSLDGVRGGPAPRFPPPPRDQPPRSHPHPRPRRGAQRADVLHVGLPRAPRRPRPELLRPSADLGRGPREADPARSRLELLDLLHALDAQWPRTRDALAVRESEMERG